jgi:hypothetical protein
MHIERTKYRIHDQKTGQTVALIDADGILFDEGDPQAIAKLKELLQRVLVVRDRQLGFDAEDENEGYEPFPEESMCYFGMITLRPSDPEYLPPFSAVCPTSAITKHAQIRSECIHLGGQLRTPVVLSQRQLYTRDK